MAARDLVDRATVTGGNGRFSLQPIIVQTYGSKVDAAWLDRLLRTYREKGWRYKVIQEAPVNTPESANNGSGTRRPAFFPNGPAESRDRMRLCCD